MVMWRKAADCFGIGKKGRPMGARQANNPLLNPPCSLLREGNPLLLLNPLLLAWSS
jgi:hypothetical protein